MSFSSAPPQLKRDPLGGNVRPFRWWLAWLICTASHFALTLGCLVKLLWRGMDERPLSGLEQVAVALFSVLSFPLASLESLPVGLAGLGRLGLNSILWGGVITLAIGAWTQLQKGKGVAA